MLADRHGGRRVIPRGNPSSSSLLSLQVLEGPWALSWVIQESMSLKYEPIDAGLFWQIDMAVDAFFLAEILTNLRAK